MLNLLPQQKKNLIRKEYHGRLITVILVFGTITVAIWFIFLMPSFLVARAKFTDLSYVDDSLKAKIDTEKNKETNFTPVQRDMLNALQDSTSTAPLPTELLDSVLKAKGDNISLTDFSLEKNGEEAQFLIHGTADTRDALISFKETLGKDPTWSAVDLPISDVGPATHNLFSITLTIAPLK